MTKQELVAVVARRNRITKVSAGLVFDDIFRLIGNAVVREGRFLVPGFGTWRIRSRRSRRVRNPQTKEFMQLPQINGVAFRPALLFRRKALAGGRA